MHYVKVGIYAIDKISLRVHFPFYKSIRLVRWPFLFIWQNSLCFIILFVCPITLFQLNVFGAFVHVPLTCSWICFVASIVLILSAYLQGCCITGIILKCKLPRVKTDYFITRISTVKVTSIYQSKQTIFVIWALMTLRAKISQNIMNYWRHYSTHLQHQSKQKILTLSTVNLQCIDISLKIIIP